MRMVSRESLIFPIKWAAAFSRHFVMKLSFAKCKLVTAVRLPGQEISKFAPTQHIWKLPTKFRQARKMPEVCRFYGIIIRFSLSRASTDAFSRELLTIWSIHGG